jgi:hypothetical protein
MAENPREGTLTDFAEASKGFVLESHSKHGIFIG